MMKIHRKRPHQHRKDALTFIERIIKRLMREKRRLAEIKVALDRIERNS